MISSPTKSISDSSLAQKRAALAARLQKVASLPRQSPLSFAQQRLWFLDQLEPNSPLYNIAAVARIDGAVDLARLQQAFDAIVSRHETLRTRFVCPDETPVQLIDPHRGFQLAFVDLSNLAPGERDAEEQRLVRVETNK